MYMVYRTIARNFGKREKKPNGGYMMLQHIIINELTIISAENPLRARVYYAVGAQC